MFFQKKPKKSEAELEAERVARIENTCKKFEVQLLQVSKNKEGYITKLLKAKAQGLPEQELILHNKLVELMKMEKQIMGMAMSMQIALQAREVASLTKSFMECMASISEDIIAETKETDGKTAQKTLMKAAYNQQKQSEMLDQMMETQDFTMLGQMDKAQSSEFDHEIDALLQNAARAKGYTSIPGNKDKI